MSNRVRDNLRTVSRVVLAGMVGATATGGVSPAWAYIGDSFLSIPNEPGHWRGDDHKGWIRAEASVSGVLSPRQSRA